MTLLTQLVLLASGASAFYLPGVAPTSYVEGETVPLMVNHITPSLRKEDENAKPLLYSYDYYFDRFHLCKPEEGLVEQSESLGSIIFGDRIFNSPFQLNLLENTTCNSLCSSTYPAKDAKFFNDNIRSGFQYNWMIDGLPVARQLVDFKTDDTFYSTGFNIGYDDEQNAPHIYNHFDLFVEYHLRADGTYRIVGTTVNPRSFKAGQCSKEEFEPQTLNEETDTEVQFTYSVYWVPSNTPWATRWDKYLHVYDPKIQWFALINFSIVVLILSFIMSHVLFSNLKKDLTKYNNVNLDDDVIDEMGWKLIHGDVFRAPKNPMILSVLVGSGVQLMLMIVCTCFFALFGLLSPSNRGSLATVMFVLYAVFGLIGSFFSAFIYKVFNGQDWKINMILTPILVPGIIFASFVLMNFLLIFVHSSGAVPFGTMLAIITIWFIVSIPLSCIGSLLGIRKVTPEAPCKVNQIPRQIPSQPWYLRTPVLSLIAGIFPFGAIAIEMYFIFTSIWFNRIYYMFGFLFFCVILMIFTCALVTLLMVYYSLCNEDYEWQWKAFCIGAGVGGWVWIHALFLAKTGGASLLLYLGYSTLMAGIVALVGGSIGVLSAWFLCRGIYSRLRVD